MPPFLRQQLDGLREEGAGALLRKAGIFLSLLPALPLVLLARLLRPIWTVRFGRLIAERVGHLAWNTEFYLLRRDAQRARSTDIFCWTGESANRQLMRMWARVLRMSPWVWPLWKLNHLLPGGAGNEVDLPFNFRNYERARDLAAETKTHLQFTPEEESEGRRALLAMGVPEGAPFICFHARDSAYLAAQDARRDWQYHDYRDARIANFLPAVEELARRGYYALRMGAVVGGPLDAKNPKIIDYAVSRRSEFMDIYLCGRCSFFLASNAGIADVADVFRRPLARTNVVQYFAEFILSGKKDLFIFKKLWLKAEGRFMTLREMMRSEAWTVRSGEVFEKLGIEPRENEPEDILDLAVELEERLGGRWRSAPEDEELQSRFWGRLSAAGKLSAKPVSRVGARFLRKNRALLE